MIRDSLYRSTRHLALELASVLQRRGQTVVFAESCTAGLAAGLLAQVPGISQWLCGSMVTYQESAKQDWLQIDPEVIRRYSAVSPQVTGLMASSVLERTPAARFAVAVTGHLQRDASADGAHAFVGQAWRYRDRICNSQPVRYTLEGTTRVDRQWQAARATLHSAVEHLRFPPEADGRNINWSRLCGRPEHFTWNHWI